MTSNRYSIREKNKIENKKMKEGKNSVCEKCTGENKIGEDFEVIHSSGW